MNANKQGVLFADCNQKLPLEDANDGCLNISTKIISGAHLSKETKKPLCTQAVREILTDVRIRNTLSQRSMKTREEG